MIPEDATIVYDGKKFRVYNWEQELFDGTTDVFEAVQRKPSVQILPIIDKEIIVAKEKQPHRKPFTGLIGGMIEFDEEPKHGAKRELLEETGYKAKKWNLLFETNLNQGFHWDILYYSAHDLQKKEEQNLDPGEDITLKKMSFDQFIRFTQRDDFRSKPLQQKIQTMDEDEIKEFGRRLYKNTQL